MQPFAAVAGLLMAGVFASSCATPFWEGVPEGSPAPSLPEVEWLDTEEAPPASLAAWRGSPVLVEFWSRQCRPCVEHIPTIQRFHEAYRDRGLRVVSVHLSLDFDDPRQDRAVVQAFVDRAGIRYPVGMDHAGAGWETFEFDFLPHVALLDSDGVVRWSGNLCVSSVDSTLEDLLGAAGDVEVTSAAADPSSLVEGITCEDGVCHRK